MSNSLVVGASRGIGRAIVEEQLRRGGYVIATVRNRSALSDLQGSAGGRLRVELLDVRDREAIDELRNALAGVALDYLIVSAGIEGPRTVPIGEAMPEAFCEMMLVNALAPLRIIDRLATHIKPTGIAAVMSSQLGSLAHNDTGGLEAYRMSKAALNMGLLSMAARLGTQGRTFLAVNPGWVRTDMGGPSAPLSAQESVPSLIDVLELRRGSGGCAFVRYDGVEMEW